MDDAALVLAARAGDGAALASIYERYGDRLHDYCWSILRDRDEAADAFHDAFVLAAQRLDQLREPAKLRPWLYAIARHEALRRAAARRRQQPAEEVDEMTATGAGPDARLRQDEAARLVWAAAAGLADRDRALLDLNLRQGLEGQDLADAIGVEPSHAYVLLSRLRDQVERSLGALLVARYARSDCADLARVLAGWDGRFSPLVRKRVARHADQCEVCGERRRTLASPLALLSAVPLLPAPDRLRERVLDDARLVAHASPAPRWDAGRGGFPPPLYPPPRRSPMVTAALAAAALVVAVALGIALLDPFGPEGDEVGVAAVAPTTTLAAAAPPVTVEPAATTTTISGSAPAATAPAATHPPTTAPPTTTTTGGAPSSGPRLRLAATELDFGDAATEQVLEIANDGDRPLDWTATASPPAFTAAPAAGTLAPGASTPVTVHLDRAAANEGEVAGTIQITSGGGNASVALRAAVAHPPVVRAAIDRPRLSASPCSAGPTAATVEASVSDESTVASAVLRWRTATGATGSFRLVPVSAGTYTGRLGPFSTPGTVTWWVEATDTLGATGRSRAQSTPVDACR